MDEDEDEEQPAVRATSAIGVTTRAGPRAGIGFQFVFRAARRAGLVASHLAGYHKQHMPPDLGSRMMDSFA